MNSKFDIYNNYEIPQLILTNPNEEEIAIISHAKDVNITLRFGSYSELSFTVAENYNNDTKIPYYKLLQQMRQIKVDDFGVFVITSVSEINDGVNKHKEISCKSIESLFARESIVGLDDTVRLYDPTGTETSIVGMFLKAFPNWGIGYVDASLYHIYRTYNITEDNWYNFLFNSVTQDYECVIRVDTFNKKISIYTIENGVIETDIYLSFFNLAKKFETETVEDGIKTAIEVYGANNLGIHDVNPLGTSVLYNYSYYKNTDWIKEDTVNAITKWENLITKYTPTYKDCIEQIKNNNNLLVTLKSQLKQLEEEKATIEILLAARAEQRLDTASQSYSLSNKNNEIASKNNEIENVKNTILSLENEKSEINNKLSFINNFTEEQLIDLKSITIQGTYSNDSFAITDSMRTSDILEREQELMSTATKVLSKECQPRYTVSGELINFLALKEFKPFSNQLEIGCSVTVGMNNENYKFVLVEYSIEFEDLTKSSVKFSTSSNLKDGMITFADLFDGMQSTISSVSTSVGIWEDYIKSGGKDSVQRLLSESLDLSQKEILSSTSQNVEINGAGLWLRKKLENGEYDPKQFLMTNNAICMTDSNWTKTPKMVMGKFNLDGVECYGCCKDTIFFDIIK